MLGERLPGRRPLQTRPQRSARSSRETASRPRSKPAHVRLVFRDPAGHLIRRKSARLGQRGALGPESRRQKEHQLLLLGRRESRSGRFDLGKSDHQHKRTPHTTQLPRESADCRSLRTRHLAWHLRSLGADSCGVVRGSPCVGFCVALNSKPAYSRGKSRLFSIPLGELSRRVMHRLAWSRTDDVGRPILPMTLARFRFRRRKLALKTQRGARPCWRPAPLALESRWLVRVRPDCDGPIRRSRRR